MCENNGIFAGKLHEIEGQYGRILSRLRVAQYESHDEIRRTIRQLEAECRGTESLLKQSIADCRSPAVSALSAGVGGKNSWSKSGLAEKQYTVESGKTYEFSFILKGIED